MIRETKQQQQRIRIPAWIALALAATVATGCSSASPTSPGGGFPGTSSTTGPSMMTTPGSSDTTGSSGASATPTATSTATAAPTATPTATGTAPAPSATGTTPAPASTDNNTFISMPADDLAPPDPADGIQFITPPMAFSVAPNQEIFPNYCVIVPKDISVGGFRSWMTANSSHHFILYMAGTAAAGTQNGANCSMGAGQWVYATSTPGAITGMNMPQNVGLDMSANTELIINMHFINPGTTTAYPQVKINILFAKNVMYKAATMISFNTSINVPAGTESAPGKQTVSGTCTAPVGANFFTMSTHTHKHAVAATITYNHNGTSTEVVHTGPATTYPADQEKGSGVDWEHPGVGSWASAPFLTVQQGDTFTYSCSYENTSSTAVTVGETAASNEMCMAVTYWFPASLGSAFCR